MESKDTLIKSLLGGLTLTMMTTTGWLALKNKTERDEFAKEKSVFAAEKQMYTKSLKELAAEKQNLANLSSDRKKRIEELLNEIDGKNREITWLTSEKSKSQNLKKKIGELEQTRLELMAELDNVNRDLKYINLSNSALENEMDLLRIQNEKLYSELLFSKALNSNVSLIQGVKGNDKITAWARLSKEINFSFDYPADNISEMDILIQTPDGRTFTSKDTDKVSLITGNEEQKNLNGIATKRVHLSLKPEKKFAKGIYNFTVLKSTSTVATYQIQLK